MFVLLRLSHFLLKTHSNALLFEDVKIGCDEK